MYCNIIWKNHNQGDDDGDTKLHFAAASGQQSKLLKYAKFNCNINCVNKLGWTPLMQACRNGHLECVRSLIQFGADLSYRNKFGICTLSLAAASGNIEIIHFVLKSLVQNQITIFELEKIVSPAVFAILFSNIDVLRYFINNSFDLRKTNFIGGLSSVQFALTINNKDIMSLLKRRGLTPLNINMASSRKNSVTNSPFIIPPTPSPHYNSNLNNSLIPSFIIVQSPTIFDNSSPNLFKTPNSGRHIISPMFSPKIIRQRKCSNISTTSVYTPNISPISKNSSSLCMDDSFMNQRDTTDYFNKDILNQRVRTSPYKLRFSSTSSTDSASSFLKCDSKIRSSSYCVPPTPNVTPSKLDDEVFDSSPIIINKSKEQFIEILRKNSLDSCISLFEKHEIDMDLFLTLSKNDLEEIGVDWHKRDTLLEVIYHLNKE